MAKRGEGTPSIKRAEERRRHLSRAEREKRTSRLVIIGTSALVGVVILLIIIGILYELVIEPSQPVAVVAGTTVTSSQFENRVKYERFRAVEQYYNLGCNTQQGQQFFAQYCQQLEQNLQFPTTLGNQALTAMIEEAIIRQEAEDRDIELEPDAAQEQIYELFGYDPSPALPTPTLEPSPPATPRRTRIPKASPTPPEATFTPTLEPSETPLPTNTLTPDEEKELFDENYATRLAMVAEISGMGEAAYRDIFRARALREKLYDEITANISPVAEQMHIRQIRVSTEQDAIDLLEALRAGESFAELARNATAARDAGDPNTFRGGDLGWLPPERLTPNVADAVMEADIGEVLGPIQDTDLNALEQGVPTDYYYIVQVLGREIRPIEENLLQTMRDEHFQTWLNSEVSQAERSDFWSDRVPEDPTQEQIVEIMQNYFAEEEAAEDEPPTEAAVGEEEEETPED